MPTELPTTTVRIWLITVIVPLKLTSSFPVAAVNVNDPEPVPDAVPLAPELSVIQVVFGTADQTQPVCVFTVTVPVPPPGESTTSWLDREYEQAPT